MAFTIEAVYENGVLKPTEPLPFKEHEKVRITVEAPVSRLSDLSPYVLGTADAVGNAPCRSEAVPSSR